MITSSVVALPRRDGFTLIELSIVLVIIGLIVGGILVGQDLIRASALRATMKEVEGFRSAINTFRSKYNAIPGDLTSTQAAQFSMAARTNQTYTGNGSVDDAFATASSSTVGSVDQEYVLFWEDLSSAGLGNFNIAGNAVSGINATTETQIQAILPKSKIGRQNYWQVMSFYAANYFLLEEVTNISSGQANFGQNITPLEGQAIDTKMDDGAAATGTVTAVSTIWNLTPGSIFVSVNGNNVTSPVSVTNQNACRDLGPAFGGAGVNMNSYNTGGGYGNNPACGLLFSF